MEPELVTVDINIFLIFNLSPSKYFQVKKPAEAEKYKLEKLAEAERLRIVLEAEANAEALAVKGEAEAFAIGWLLFFTSAVLRCRLAILRSEVIMLLTNISLMA